MLIREPITRSQIELGLALISGHESGLRPRGAASDAELMRRGLEVFLGRFRDRPNIGSMAELVSRNVARAAIGDCADLAWCFRLCANTVPIIHDVRPSTQVRELPHDTLEESVSNKWRRNR